MMAARVSWHSTLWVSSFRVRVLMVLTDMLFSLCPHASGDDVTGQVLTGDGDGGRSSVERLNRVQLREVVVMQRVRDLLDELGEGPLCGTVAVAGDDDTQR